MFHFILLQTKRGFDILIGPVNSPALDKDTPLIRVGFRQVPMPQHLRVFQAFHFFQFDAAVNRRLNWSLLGRPRIRLKSD